MTCYCAECDRSKVKPDGLTYLGDQSTNLVPRIPPVSELKVVGTDTDRTMTCEFLCAGLGSNQAFALSYSYFCE